MKNTNSKEYKDAQKAYLLPIIQERAANMGQTITGNPYAWVLDVAKSESGHDFRKGDQTGMTNWLQGLGMGIDFYNADIIRVCEQLHGCTLAYSQAGKCVENWFSHIAFKIIQFSKEL